MRLLPILAALTASLGLAACTVNTAPPPPPPSATIVTPAPQPMMMAPASPSVIVR